MSIISDIADRLDKVSYTSWRTGYLEDWTIWAKQMRDTIHSVVPIMRTLENQVDVSGERIRELESALAEKDRLISLLISGKSVLLQPERHLDIE